VEEICFTGVSERVPAVKGKSKSNGKSQMSNGKSKPAGSEGRRTSQMANRKTQMAKVNPSGRGPTVGCKESQLADRKLQMAKIAVPKPICEMHGHMAK